MGKTVARLQELENRLHTGRIAIVSLTDEPAPEEAEARLQKAREEAGDKGTVIIISYGQQESYESLLLPEEVLPKVELKWDDRPAPDSAPE